MERNANAYYDLLSATVELFRERIEQDQLTEDNCHDALHEVVDGQVPHYYHEIFTVMAADGIDHEFDDAGLMPDTKDVTVILQARIYEALYNDVLSDTSIEWYEGEEEWEQEENTLFYVISDENTGPHVICSFYSLEEAKEAAYERYNTLGKLYHVEGDTSSEVLYDPSGVDNSF